MKKILCFIILLCSVHTIYAEDTDTIAERLCKEAEDCYTGSNGAFLNKEKALELYIQAAERNYVPAIMKVAGFYWRGETVEKDVHAYFLWISKAAELGDGTAQNNLGVCYHDGNGIAKDLKQARYWYEQAAEKNNVYAMNNLRQLCNEEKDVEGEIKWTRAGAEHGHKDCQYKLALDYDGGYGVKADEEQAEYWYKKAADQGHGEACNYYSVICHNRNDYTNAYEYARKAIENNSKNAFFNMGYLYEFGQGVNQDYIKAEQYYQKAIDVENANRNSAYFRLGKMYYEGNAVIKKDKKKGEDLLKQAANNGNEDAKKYLEENKVKWSISINGQKVLSNDGNANQ